MDGIRMRRVEGLTAVLMGGDDAASSASRATETSIRGFWKAYRKVMDI